MQEKADRRVGMDIYRYDDYRLFLSDSFKLKVAADPSYSQRRFAREAGFSNPGFFNDVIKGRRKLSKAAVEKMVSVFALSFAEAEFFRLLVKYRHASDLQSKQETYSQIVFRRNRSAFSRLNPALSRYYQDYRYPLLRTAVMATVFRGNYEELGRFVEPPIPAFMVKKYIRDLCEWGLLVQGTDGQYRATSEFVEPPDTLCDILKQINKEWITQSIDALIRFPKDKRHISTALLSVTGKTSEIISRRIEEFREEIWELVKNDTGGADRVMQLNIQFFPKTAERLDK